MSARNCMALSLLAAALAAGPARAAEGPDYWFSVTPLLAYRVSNDLKAEGDGEDLSLDEDAAAGVIVTVPAEVFAEGGYTEWELYASRQSVSVDDPPPDTDPGFDVDITHVLLGGNVTGPGEWVRPYLSAGIGAARLSPDAPGYASDTVFAFGLGLGAQFFPESRVGLRLEVRGLGAVLDNDSDVFCRPTGDDPPAGEVCLIRLDADVLWQWEAFAGVVARF